jgi:hypothetical protein
MRAHAYSCEACRTFAEELVEVREILGAQENKTEPGPFFLARVMASIASREVGARTKSPNLGCGAAVGVAADGAGLARFADRGDLGIPDAERYVLRAGIHSSGRAWWIAGVQDDLLVRPAGNRHDGKPTVQQKKQRFGWRWYFVLGTALCAVMGYAFAHRSYAATAPTQLTAEPRRAQKREQLAREVDVDRRAAEPGSMPFWMRRRPNTKRFTPSAIHKWTRSGKRAATKSRRS